MGFNLTEMQRLAGIPVTEQDHLDESKASAEKAGIRSPNSSGQGFHPDHKKNPYHLALERMGFPYSHTTPISMDGGKTFSLHHTYKLSGRDFSLGVHQSRSGGWMWEGGAGGSGRRKVGEGGSSLTKYLKGVKRRLKVEGTLDDDGEDLTEVEETRVGGNQPKAKYSRQFDIGGKVYYLLFDKTGKMIGWNKIMDKISLPSDHVVLDSASLVIDVSRMKRLAGKD